MELRRSRRLAGLEPDVFHEEQYEEVELRHNALVEEVQQVVVCSKISSAVAIFLASLNMGIWAVLLLRLLVRLGIVYSK
jgi:hypothetical protein